jgi:serine/threonine protein kinase
MKKCPRCGREFQDNNTLCPSDGSVLEREDDLIGQTLAGKYRIEAKISEGGMGCVYRATHVLMEKTVAIKVLHPALAADDKIVARFTREAKASSRISHPHAITVTDFGEAENGIVFLVMEYLRGRTLKEEVRANGPMELKRAAEIVRQVGGALEAAHAEGVVHRDLKSDNIMLDEKPGGGGDWATVLDFGIAKIKEPVGGKQDPALTAPNLIIGTPQYMSPEQCSQASNIDSRTDIYSLGVIIYELLAGHVPFSGDSPTETMMKHMQEPVPSLREDRPDIPAAVDEIIQRAMAKSPEDRFRSAGAMAEAFLLAASDRPTHTEAASAIAASAGKSAATDGQGAPAPQTNRIVVSTGENEPPRHTGGEDREEETVVTARPVRRERETGAYAPAPPPPPAASFNPWRVAVPAVALLAIVFGAFYLFQGNSSPADNQTPALTTDPAGQPVVATTPPTGAGESHLTPSNVAATPTPALTEGGTAVPPTGTNTSTTPAATPTADENKDDEDEGEEEPAPTPAPTPPARRPTPPPAATPTDVRPDTPAKKPAPTPPPPAKDDPPPPISPQP